jgi:hypothetical protein
VSRSHPRSPVAAALLLLVVTAGCALSVPAGPVQPAEIPTPVAASTSTVTPATPAPPATAAQVGLARAALDALTVKGRAALTGYAREAFGVSWRDLDRNGCDQRNDVLRRDLRDITIKPGTHGCLVLTGTLLSPYSGETVPFVRGLSTSREVQIDHVVALGDAWQKGAQQWSPEKRERFANDFLELRATDMHTNASKGARDAATWLPPRKRFRCGYVARQIAVKQAYGLWVTPAERDAMARVLDACPQQGLPRSYPIALGA